MLALVILLLVTNLVTLAALGYLYLRPVDDRGPDASAAGALDRTPPLAVVRGTRRIISVEILNPIELANTRGRIVGIAGSLAPGLTRRIVYDQTLKVLRRQLVEQRVVADVRLHTLRPVPITPPVRPAQVVRPEPADLKQPPVPYTDEIVPLDLTTLDDRPE